MRNGSKTLLLVALAATACAREQPHVKAPTPVRVTAAEAVVAPRGHRYSATLQPHAQVSVAFRSSGYVESIRRVPAGGTTRLLQGGDTVAKGTLLASVRATDTAARVAQARAGVAEAEASLERTRLDFARAESLFASASLTRADLDAARAGARMGEARAAAAKAQLSSAEIAHEDTKLVAPLGGVVLSRAIEEGSLVAPGMPGFVIAETETMKAVFGVPDLVVSTMKIGDPIPVAAEAVPGVLFAGRITALSPSADPTSRAFDVEVTIPNNGSRLKTGMVAGVEVKGDASMPAPTLPAVPLAAVLKSPKGAGLYAVFVVETEGEKSTARAREVKLGEIAGNRVVVASGLKPGESVVVTGASLLADGEAVLVIP